jgi:hypothetical protein
MNKAIVILILVIFNYSQLYSQEKNIFSDLAVKKSSQGKIHIFQDAETKVLLNDYVEAKKDEKVMKGYRVQIFFGSGHSARENANTIRNSFVSKYKEVPAHVLFEDPNFKVRVGDFRNKSEALKVLVQIESEYKGAYIVTDYIELPKLED